MKYILDENGNPVPCKDVLKWAEWFENNVNMTFAETILDDVRVSTVFLGLDHCFSYPKTGKPLLWETMIFNNKDETTWNYQVRYSSKEDAAKGHAEAVKYVIEHNGKEPNET